MNWFQRQLQKMMGSRAFRAILWGQGTTDYTKWDKRKLIEQGYERNPVFASIVDRISLLVADLPLYVEYNETSGKRRQTTMHPLLRAMERSDNGMQSFIQRSVLYYLVCGETYLQKLIYEQGGKRKLMGFVVLPAQYTNPIQGTPANPIIGYQLVQNGTVNFGADDVISVQMPSLSEYFHGTGYGVSLAETMDFQNSALTWNKNIAQAGGSTSLVIKAPGIDETGAKALKDTWVANQGGAGNAHKPIVTGGSADMEILNLNFKPNDAEWARGIELATRMIAMRMGFPSELLNDPSGKTYANVSEATKTLYRDCVIPIANRFFGAINRHCSTYYDDSPMLRVDLDKVIALQEDRKLAFERAVMAVRAGVLTPNEAREELGYTAHESETASELLAKPYNTGRSVGNNPQL